MSTAAPKLLTAEEFAKTHSGDHVELIDGAVKELPMPMFPHGVINVRFARLLGNFVDENDLGWVASNDTFVLTQRNPDRVRGADVCYWSYHRVPKGAMPSGVVEAPPELVAEVRSPSDRWLTVLQRACEYLEAGVKVVVVLDLSIEVATVYRSDQMNQVFCTGSDFSLPDLFPDWSVPVATFFEGI